MKTAFITGATSGIGKAIALRLSKQNMKLILTGRNEEQLNLLCNELKENTASEVYPLVFDVRNLQACESAINSLPEAFQNIDILINNAGLAVELDPLHEANIEDWERMIDTNIKGLLYVSRLITPRMVAQKSGHIINLGSTASHEIYVGGSVYCSTKHAVLAISKGMRSDFLPYNIKVTCICPGAVETNFSNVRFHGNTERAEKVYEGYTPLSGDDVANVVEYVLSLPEHVCLNEVIITCTAQFNGTIIKNK